MGLIRVDHRATSSRPRNHQDQLRMDGRVERHRALVIPLTSGLPRGFYFAKRGAPGSRAPRPINSACRASSVVPPPKDVASRNARPQPDTPRHHNARTEDFRALTWRCGCECWSVGNPARREQSENATQEATQGQISSQSPSDATPGRQHWNRSWLQKPSICPRVVWQVVKTGVLQVRPG